MSSVYSGPILELSDVSFRYPGDRLIQQEDLGIRCQATDNGQQFLLAVRQSTSWMIGLIGKTDLVQQRHRLLLVNSLLSLALAPTEEYIR